MNPTGSEASISSAPVPAVPPAAGFPFDLDTIYIITGVVLAIFAVMCFADRQHRARIGSGLFWLILAIIFAFGTYIPHWVTGMLVLAMVALDGIGQVTRGSIAEPTKEEQLKHAKQLGDRIFAPVLIIPIVTFAFAIAFRFLGFDVNKGSLVGLGYGGIVAMIAGVLLTRSSMKTVLGEGRRLNETMGAVNILPQLLASLGVIFKEAEVGDLIAEGIKKVVPEDNLFLLVLANCLSMSLFTMVMGNSFAAFSVIANGVLIPLIIKPFGADPAMAAIITLTAGSSGTLITPMAANFNIVPAALLNMRDAYGIMRFQLPFALAIFTLHVLTMWMLIKLLA